MDLNTHPKKKSNPQDFVEQRFPLQLTSLDFTFVSPIDCLLPVTLESCAATKTRKRKRRAKKNALCSLRTREHQSSGGYRMTRSTMKITSRWSGKKISQKRSYSVRQMRARRATAFPRLVNQRHDLRLLERNGTCKTRQIRRWTKGSVEVTTPNAIIVKRQSKRKRCD